MSSDYGCPSDVLILPQRRPAFCGVTSRLSLVAGLLFIAGSAAGGEPVRARHAIVVSAEDHATMAGLAVLRKGGNAIDAAITVGFVLAVTHPAAGNIGGGGFMLIRFADGRSTFIDFRERAPAAATRDMFLGDDGEPTSDSVVGYRAVAVPGTVRGFELARKKYGARPWAELVKPAVRLARKGFSVSEGLAESLRANARLPLFAASRRIFLRNGRPYEPGERFRQRKLHATLKRIARRGPGEFYRGKTARLIAADMKRNGGLITMADLAEYEPVERRPLVGHYRDYEILGAPPPSSGGAGVIQMLNMLEGTGYAASGAGSASSIHYVAEVMRRFFADRAEHFGDADFADVPIEKLTGKKYAADRRSTIGRDRATPSENVRPGRPLGYESPETTHYSIVDAEGNAVAVTYTLNGLYGSGVTARGTGVLLNNIMDDFTSKPGEPNMFGLLQSEKNAIEPRKRPLSAMTPTIVSRGGELFMVLGAPGGPTIISTVLQIITNVADFNMDLQQAVDFPHFHHQWMPDELRMEDAGFSPQTIEGLKERGHRIKLVSPMGRAMAIKRDGDWLVGAADSRSEGTARGY